MLDNMDGLSSGVAAITSSILAGYLLINRMAIISTAVVCRRVPAGLGRSVDGVPGSGRPPPEYSCVMPALFISSVAVATLLATYITTIR
jgi:hypothetical protein